MNFIKKFKSSFTSPSAQKEYESLSRTQVIRFFRVFLFMMALYCIFAIIKFLVEKDYTKTYAMIACSVILLLLCKFCEKLEKVISILVIAFFFGLAAPTLIELFKILQLSPLLVASFSMGYIFGFYERLVTIRLPGFLYKLVFTLGSLLVRGIIFGNMIIPHLLEQCTIIIIALVLDFFKIREDERVFQSFYDYREELIKFRNLMVSGLPSKILILSSDLKNKLFINERFQNILDQHIVPQGNKDANQQINEFLNKIQIDKRSLNDTTKMIVDSHCRDYQALSALQLLQALSEQSLFSEHGKKIIFHTFLNPENYSERRAYEIKTFSLLWDGQEAVAVILDDITEQYQNLSLKIADANKDKMLALISHELRTPLNGILGMVQLLEKRTTDTANLQHLKVCKASGELLLNLVNSILDLQHIRDNKFSLKVSKVDLYELLQEVYDLFRFQFEQKGLKLALNAALDLPQSFSTDQNRLKQVLINLLGNALKFTFEGGVEISVIKDMDYVQFRVTDTGTGIKEEDQGKLFKMYGRLDQEDPKTNTQGVGFGLEISNQLATMLCEGEKGGIKCNSQVGEGTTFSFFIKENTSGELFKPKSKPQNQKIVWKNDTEETDLDGLNCDELLVMKEKIEDLSLKVSPYSMQTFTKIQMECVNQTPQNNRMITTGSTHFSQNFLAPIPCKYQEADEISSSESINKSPKNNTFGGGGSQAELKTTRTGGYKVRFPNGEILYSESCDALIFEKDEKRSPKNNQKKQLRILVVDDNPFNLLIARRLAENLGYATNTALNGKIAVEMLKNCKENNEEPYCAVLMDLQMPVMDGYEATKVLRKMMENGEIAEIPIIALSANDSQNDKNRCKEIGMSDHISKPLDEKRLKKVLGTVIVEENDIKEMKKED